jgi:hypothetical protein
LGAAACAAVSTIAIGRAPSANKHVNNRVLMLMPASPFEFS